MSTLSRLSPDARVLELTRQLAEDYHRVPLPEVSRIVREAATVVMGHDDWSGTNEGLPALVAVIEEVARADLEALGAGGQPTGASPASTVGSASADTTSRR